MGQYFVSCKLDSILFCIFIRYWFLLNWMIASAPAPKRNIIDVLYIYLYYNNLVKQNKTKQNMNQTGLARQREMEKWDTANELKIMDCMPKFFTKIKWSQLFERLVMLLLLCIFSLQLICACGHEFFFSGPKNHRKLEYCIVCEMRGKRVSASEMCVYTHRIEKGIFLIIDALVWCVSMRLRAYHYSMCVCVWIRILTKIYI